MVPSKDKPFSIEPELEAEKPPREKIKKPNKRTKIKEPEKAVEAL